MHRRLETILITSALCGVALAGAAHAESDAGERTFAITITNLTKGQVLTPAVIATHSRNFQMFEAGDEASEGLSTMAESGMPDLLAEELMAEPGVRSVAVGAGVIPPGSSETILVVGGGHHQLFSVAGMLASTNDSFYAAQGRRLSRRSMSGDAIVYDAGSEGNNESCDNVPGPPCAGPNNRDTETAEGFIHVANGVHGIADLPSDLLDWRGPAARIEVREVE